MQSAASVFRLMDFPLAAIITNQFSIVCGFDYAMLLTFTYRVVVNVIEQRAQSRPADCYVCTYIHVDEYRKQQVLFFDKTRFYNLMEFSSFLLLFFSLLFSFFFFKQRWNDN